MGRPPTHSDVAERFEDRYRQTPGSHLGRTADTVEEIEVASRVSSEVLSHWVEGPVAGPPVVGQTSWEPRDLITSTPATRDMVNPVDTGQSGAVRVIEPTGPNPSRNNGLRCSSGTGEES